MTDREVKDYLFSYQDAWKDIDAVREEVAILRSRAEKVTSVISAAPSGGNSAGNGFTSAVDKIVVLEEKLHKKIFKAIELREEIESKIELIDVPIYRRILRRRYINGVSLKSIAAAEGYNYTYICEQHGAALEAFRNKTSE